MTSKRPLITSITVISSHSSCRTSFSCCCLTSCLSSGELQKPRELYWNQPDWQCTGSFWLRLQLKRRAAPHRRRKLLLPIIKFTQHARNTKRLACKLVWTEPCRFLCSPLRSLNNAHKRRGLSWISPGFTDDVPLFVSQSVVAHVFVRHLHLLSHFNGRK